MGFVERLLQKRIKKKIRKLPKIERGRARFEHAYQMKGYEYGFGSYGLPVVHDWSEGTSLKIGRFCSIAEDVNIFLGGNHRSDWVSTFPFPAFNRKHAGIKEYAVSRGDVIVGNDVWLCTGVKILSGVKVGDGAVVAAYSVVSRDVEPYTVVAGNPAKMIRYREALNKPHPQRISW